MPAQTKLTMPIVIAWLCTGAEDGGRTNGSDVDV